MTQSLQEEAVEKVFTEEEVVTEDEAEEGKTKAPGINEEFQEALTAVAEITKRGSYGRAVWSLKKGAR